MQLVRIGIYAWMVKHVALFTLSPESIWVWISALLVYDFCYYWLHRMGHEVNVLWAMCCGPHTWYITRGSNTI